MTPHANANKRAPKLASSLQKNNKKNKTTAKYRFPTPAQNRALRSEAQQRRARRRGQLVRALAHAMRLAVGLVGTLVLVSSVANAQHELESIPVIPVTGCGERGVLSQSAEAPWCRFNGVVGLRTVVTLPARYVVHAVSVTLDENNGEQPHVLILLLIKTVSTVSTSLLHWWSHANFSLARDSQIRACFVCICARLISCY